MRARLLALATTILLTSLSFAQQAAPPLLDVLGKNKNLTTLNDLLTKQFPDLIAILSTQQSFQSYVTLLAPSNDAFKRLQNSAIGPAFAANETDVIREVLKYHIIPGDHQLKTVNQSFGFFPTLLENATYTNVTGGQRVGFVRQGSTELIVTSGGGSRSRVDEKDIFFNGGVMHVIDFPVVPPQTLVPAAVPFNLTGFLAAAYQNESLAQYISDARDVTLFVPDNAAFERVGSTITSIDEASLSNLLDYHIVVGRGGPFYTSSFQNNTIYQTLQGQNITIRQASNSNFVNSARMLQTDLLIANGVMHVIDNVLNANGTGAAPDPALGTQAPALSGSSQADTPFTSIIPSLTSTAAVTGTSATKSGETRKTSSTQSSSNAESTKKSAASTMIATEVQRFMLLCGAATLWVCL